MNSEFESFSKKTWLLVDDTSEVLSLMSALLSNLTDAKIECFGSPADALAAFANAPGKYELVITDYEMPGLDGLELCRLMKALVPTQKILLATGSGFFTEAAAQHVGFTGLLNKPFSIAKLLEALAGKNVEVAVPALA
ncbi:MAG: response regulator [Verrucomicrobiae bacterium]